MISAYDRFIRTFVRFGKNNNSFNLIELENRIVVEKGGKNAAHKYHRLSSIWMFFFSIRITQLFRNHMKMELSNIPKKVELEQIKWREEKEKEEKNE